MSGVFDLSNILGHLVEGDPVETPELKYLLGLDAPEDLLCLFEAARTVRRRHFGNQAFLYGFLYFSTFCRNNCRFCQYRQSNTGLSRYRKNEADILSAAREMTEAGVHLIDLTMGEDPEIYDSGELGFKRLVRMARTVQEETGLPVMVSPGTLPDRALADLAHAGITWYACYQETHNRDLYRRLRFGQDFDERMEKKLRAKANGMLIEEGILTGVGESLEDLAGSIRAMHALDADQVRVMTFVPQPGTPMENIRPQDNLRERVIIAVMRLVLQDRLIPASLDVDGLDGLKGRLDAGANVVTSIVPPRNGLAGVANLSLDIEESRRTRDAILPILASCGLIPAGVRDYQTWIEQRRSREGAVLKAGGKRC